MVEVSGSIILEKIVHKLCMQNDTTTSWITKGGNFQTSKKCKTTFILKEFFENKSIEWNLHVDSTPGPHHYDMILGRNIMSELRITLDFRDQTMTWNDSTINMKDPESLPDLLDSVNDFFWSNNHYKTEALLLISRKFSMQSMHRWTSTRSYRHTDISQKMKNPNCMLYFTNTNIYSMALWEHGIINPIISNLRKVLSHIIADLSLFQKFMSAL